ncbi:hypothetical protein SNE40_017176 [Patella caerulea]|uniref:PiggyBac transposable element-derived protein domain-containing protein n=1 Tax=Patella caerulea TaxID=87958 RepID=A0AAN8J9W7_PATCE
MASAMTQPAKWESQKGQRLLSVHEALDRILDDEDDLNWADIFIQPPEENELTDSDSADEDGIGATINNLSGRQLSAGCSVTFRTRHGRQSLEDDIDQVSITDYSSSDSEDNSTSIGGLLAKKRKLSTTRNWRHGDFTEDINNNFEFDTDWVEELDCTPTKLFERFLDDETVNYIVTMSKLYAQQKRKENFDMTPSDFKLCIGVILLSGYNPVPRKRMYWENSDDVRNDIVASAFPYKRFEELIKHIHLADITKLDHSDKMAKLRPLIDRLNANFLKLWPAS